MAFALSGRWKLPCTTLLVICRCRPTYLVFASQFSFCKLRYCKLRRRSYETTPPSKYGNRSTSQTFLLSLPRPFSVAHNFSQQTKSGSSRTAQPPSACEGILEGQKYRWFDGGGDGEMTKPGQRVTHPPTFGAGGIKVGNCMQ